MLSFFQVLKSKNRERKEGLEMKAKILIFSFLLIFCILEVKAEVLKSESQFKMDCSLHIKNFSGQAVDI